MEPSSTTPSTKPEILERLAQEEDLSERTVESIEQLISRIVKDKTDVPSKLWKIGDVATRLNVSTRTVENIIDNGKLTPIWIRGQRRFDPEAVEAYLRRNVDSKT